MKPIPTLLAAALCVAAASIHAEGTKPGKDATLLAELSSVPLFVRDIATCSGATLRLGANGQKATLGPMHLLRKSEVIQEVDLAAWRTDCQVLITKPSGTAVDCTPANVVGGSYMSIVEYVSNGNTSRYLWLTSAAHPAVTLVKEAPLTPSSDSGRRNVAKWLESRSVAIGDRTYDIFVYFVQDTPADMWTIDKHYRVELFDTSEAACLRHEPDQNGVISVPMAVMPSRIEPMGLTETDVGEGREKHP